LRVARIRVYGKQDPPARATNPIRNPTMNLDLLKALCETPGIPGHEDRVRELIAREVKGLFDEITPDPMGSLLCRRDARKGKGKGQPLKIMLLCHMDEIGFMVSHVSEKGFVSLLPSGGFDPRNLFSRRVLVCTASGDLKGVMNPAGPGVHISSPEDRKKIPEPHEFLIDLGLGPDTRDTVRVGDTLIQVMHWKVFNLMYWTILSNRLLSIGFIEPSPRPGTTMIWS
jgi:putative aminopeptidase FrvX